MVKALWRQARRASAATPAIRAREKAAAKPETAPAPSAANAAGARGASPSAAAESTRLQLQAQPRLEGKPGRPARVLRLGLQEEQQGKTECWRGYKAHLDVIDSDIPVSFILTSANLHDLGQAAIPLAQMTPDGSSTS